MSVDIKLDPQIRSFTSRGLTLRYADWGGEGLPVLILVHGTRDHARSWDWTARALRQEYRVLAPDLVGHGESEWDTPGGYLLPDYVYDLAQLVRLSGAERIRIIGHSLGGRIAITFAGIFSDKVEKLVAIEGMGPSDQTVRERLSAPVGTRVRRWMEEWQAAAAKQPRVYESVDTVAQRLLARNPHFTWEQGQHLAEHTVKRQADGTYLLRDDPAVRISRPFDFGIEDRAALASAVECDVLLVHGTESFLPNPVHDGREKLFRSARTVTFDNAGHWLHHDRFDDFIEEVRRFLA